MSLDFDHLIFSYIWLPPKRNLVSDFNLYLSLHYITYGCKLCDVGNTVHKVTEAS